MSLPAANRSRLHAAIACILVGLIWWRSQTIAFAIVWAVSLTLFTLACVAPRWYAPVQRTFDQLTRWLTAATTWVILALVYFAVFVPLRFWNFVIRRDPLRRRHESPTTSFLEKLSPLSPRRFERQY